MSYITTNEVINAQCCERCEVLYSEGCEHCDLCDSCDDHRECARVPDFYSQDETIPYPDNSEYGEPIAY